MIKINYIKDTWMDKILDIKVLRSLYLEGISLRKASKELKRSTRWVHICLWLPALSEKIQMKAALGLSLERIVFFMDK